VDKSGSVGSVVFGMLLEGLTRSWRAGRLVQEGRGCQVFGSLWRPVCIEAEEGKPCWLRAKGNGETMKVSP
jgi:hypothetical protein